MVTAGNYTFFITDAANTILATANAALVTNGWGSVNIPLRLVAAAPEPGTWAMLIFGFAAAGSALRRRGRKLIAALV